MRATIQFDGGAKPNPGQAYGSYQITGCYKAKKLRIPYGFATNNEAEYLALISALEDLILHSKATEVDIISDSELVVNTIQLKWKCRKPHLAVLRDRILLLLNRLNDWKATWKPRSVNVKTFGH